MNHRGPPGAEPAATLALFPSEAAWARTRVLDAQAIDTSNFDLDAFGTLSPHPHPHLLASSEGLYPELR